MFNFSDNTFVVNFKTARKRTMKLSYELGIPLSFFHLMCYDIQELNYTEGSYAEFFEKRGCQSQYHCRS